jgi:2'-5' RNA ligase
VSCWWISTTLPEKHITKVYTTAVVLCPSRETAAPIQAIREKYDRNASRWMPHITLLYPFGPYEEFDSLLPNIAAGSAAVEPFRIQLDKFRTFRRGRAGHTLWLDPFPADPVVVLQRALWAQLPVFDDVQQFANGFTPHLSIGQVADDIECDRVLLELRELWAPATFNVDRVTLIWRRDPPDDRFRVYREIMLGTGEVVTPTDT